MQDNIIDLDSQRPHEVAELICVGCGYRWIGVYPSITLLKDIECPNCGPGKVILTGQTLTQDGDDF